MFVSQIVERLSDLPDESVGNGNVLVLIQQWHNQVPDTHPRCLAVRVSHFADGLHSAHFYELDVVGVVGRVGVLRPLPERLIARQMVLNRIARLGRGDLSGGHRRGHYRESKDQ